MQSARPQSRSLGITFAIRRGIHIRLRWSAATVSTGCKTDRLDCITFSLASGPEDTGGQGGGAFLPAEAFLGTDLMLAVAAGGMTGSVVPPRGSCMRGACQRYQAYRAGAKGLGRGSLRESRPGRRRQRHWSHQLRARARSNKPAHVS